MTQDWLQTELDRKYHPAAQLFPLLEGTEYDQLKADIAEHGQLEPITLHPDGSILDGRNRHRACVDLEIAPQFVTWQNHGSAVAFVVSKNLYRRHLTHDQLVGLGLKLEPALAEEARARMLAGTLVTTGDQGKATIQAAKAVGVGSNTLYEMKAIQKEQPNLADRLIAGQTTVREQRKKKRREERVENIQQIAQGNTVIETSTRYPVVYADPPWRYEHVKTDNRAIENQYPTLELVDICALPIAELATPDAVLFLWATSPKLAEAISVLDAWGFTYRTCMVWVKDKIGMGYYARQQHELLLIATRGNLPVPEPENRPASVVNAPRLEHSTKPETFYAIIEAMYPEYDKIELFSRQKREGWGAWGNQV